jgi:stage V sporulation protein B
MAYSLPFACIHSCFNGYYYGKNKTAVPAFSQLFEQVVRVLSVYLFWRIAEERQLSFTPSHIMWGTVCGEVAAFLFCLLSFQFQPIRPSLSVTGQILRFAAPLTGSHLILNLFSSAESILIPPALLSLGHSREEALSIFGTLSGMAMPVILLPTVFTGSLSVLLLPTISSAAAAGDRGQIRRQVHHTVELCVILGLCCTMAFLLFGSFLGTEVFHSELAGSYIRALGWLCPFLFLTGTLSSILHGLDMTLYTFLLNLGGCGLRLLAIYLLVPRYGLFVYLWSMLASQMLQAGAELVILRRMV